MTRRTCAKHVFSGARGDMAGHRCGNAALKGSDFCHLHQPSVAPTTAKAKAKPEVTTGVSRTWFASLNWAPGSGPLVPIPYQSGSGYITRVLAQKTDNHGVDIKVRGVNAKKDGTPGERWWDSTYNAERLLTKAQLDALLNALREEVER